MPMLSARKSHQALQNEKSLWLMAKNGSHFYFGIGRAKKTQPLAFTNEQAGDLNRGLVRMDLRKQIE